MKNDLKIVISGDISTWNIKNFDINKIPSKYLDIIKNADLFITNLEGPIVENIDSYKFEISQNKIRDLFWKTILKVTNKKQPIVYSNEKIIDLLKLNKNTLVTLANNHIKDAGLSGFKESVGILNNNSINHIGAGLNKMESLKPFITKIKDQELLILNYNRIGLRKYGIYVDIYGSKRNDFGASYMSFKKIKDIIKNYKKNNPNIFIILIIHDGRELPKNVEESKINFDKIKNLGATLNIIHHPHNNIKLKLKNSFSLGDFIFYRPDKMAEDREGNLLKIEIENNQIKSHLWRFNFKNGYPKK